MTGRIVAGVDGSPPSMAAVEWAAADARRRSLELRLEHVCEQWARDAGTADYRAGTLEAAVVGYDGQESRTAMEYALKQARA